MLFTEFFLYRQLQNFITYSQCLCLFRDLTHSVHLSSKSQLCYLLQLRIGLRTSFQWNRVDTLEYQNNIFEYPPGRYGIIGGLCVLVLLVAIMVGIWTRRCLQKQREEGKIHWTGESEDDESANRYGGQPQSHRQSDRSTRILRYVLIVLASLKIQF